jgi:cytochrome b
LIPDGAGTFALLAAALAAGMALAIEAGRRLSRRHARRDTEASRQGLGAIEGGVFGLLGLMIAFTFGGAIERFDTRRELVVAESNAIGTAWMRLDLLQEPHRGQLRELFRRYLDSRLAIYAALPDVDAARAELKGSSAVQQEIWSAAVAACAAQPGTPQMLVIPPINEMIDLTTLRTMGAFHHTPAPILGLLFLLALGAAFLAGRAMSVTSERPLSHVLVFAVLMALAVYVILDMEYPRVGLIRVDAADQVLVELRESMK